MDSDGYGKNVKVAEKKEEDADIDIDFSKIKKIFNRSDKSHSKETPEHKADEKLDDPSFHDHGHHDVPKPLHAEAKHSKPEKKEHTEPEKEHKATPIKEPEKKETTTENNDDSEDAEIDFSKIKSIFKRDKKPHTKNDTDDDDVEFDMKKTWTSVSSAFQSNSTESKYFVMAGSIFIAFIAVIFSVWLGVSIRMEAGDLGFTDAWARNSVEQAIQNDINAVVSVELQQLQAQFPTLPAEQLEAERNQRVGERLNQARSSGTYTFQTGGFQGQTIDIQQQLDVTSNQFKAFFQYDESKGYNYMPDIDPYFWWRYARNIVETGNIGDEVVDGRQVDTAHLAPTGRRILPQDQFYPQSIVWFYNFVKIFDDEADLLRTLMVYPVFIMALTIIMTFLIGRRIAGNISGFFGAVMVGTHPSLMTRTLFGHADSDAIVVFFSVFILWLFIESMAAKRLWIRSIFALLAGFATWVYSLTWGGWWWIFDFLLGASLASIGIYVLYRLFTNFNSRSQGGNVITATLKEQRVIFSFISLAIYYVIAGIMISASWGVRVFLETPISSLGFTSIKTPVVSNAFPNVLRTVAELNEGTFRQAINQIGDTLFYIAIIGIILIGIRAGISIFKRSDDKNKLITDIFFVIILSTWLIVTMYSVTKGIRFVLLIVPAFSIAFGVVFGMIAHYVGEFLHKEFKFNKGIIYVVLFLLFFLFFPGFDLNHQVIATSRSAATNDIPIVNDAWFNSMNAIKDNSEPDAIITSWWDFGHHFKALSERKVTFDGTTQNTPQAHWVGRFFMTGDEQEAIGILRMLDCGGDTGTDRIREVVEDPVFAVMLTKEIILLDRAEAETRLRAEGFTDEEIETTLALTHCDPPEAFIVASEDMIGKSGVWGHFGGWNFTKADIWKETQGMSEADAVAYMNQEHNIKEDEAAGLWRQIENLNNDRDVDAWISPWPGISTDIQGCGRVGEIVQCGDGFTVNLTSQDAYFPTQNGNLHPSSFVMLQENETVFKREYREDVIPQQLSVLLVPQNENYFRVIASPQLVDGIFVRMFFANGHGLKHFSLLSRQQGFTGNDIYVWEVDWDGLQVNDLVEQQRPARIQAGVEDELEPSTDAMETDSMEHDSEDTEHTMDAMEETEITVTPGSTITLQYIGYLSDGSVFDSSIQGETVTNETAFEEDFSYRDLTFTAGAGAVIPGFDKGVMGLAIGEEKQIEVTPDQGYNVPGHPLFNQTLYFRVRIDSIE